MRTIAFAVTLLMAASALAAQEGWTPAPVPSTGPAQNVMPADRAGRSTGPDHDAPFSGIPTGSTTAGGATSSNQVNGVGTPSLSK